MHIVIPCKSLQLGKSRLAACLDQRARRDLCRQLLTQTLECAVDVVAPAHVRVLTADEGVAAIAQLYSVAVTPDPGGGLNAALKAARAALPVARSLDVAMLVMPIDLPFASPAAIRDARSRAGDVVIAADQGGMGTNLLLLRGAALRRFAFCYGTGSYARHLAQARSNGFSVYELSDWRLAFDIDDATQYAAWRSRVEARS
jgi:2-phospho-L-lactate/phosphoenolpyruvate guanylyltransferase